jgi:hypothetical protein
MTTSRRLDKVEKRRKLRKEKRNCKRATVMVTSGAMTFLVMVATLVTASFLISPTIERIFGGRSSGKVFLRLWKSSNSSCGRQFFEGVSHSCVDLNII